MSMAPVLARSIPDRGRPQSKALRNDRSNPRPHHQSGSVHRSTTCIANHACAIVLAMSRRHLCLNRLTNHLHWLCAHLLCSRIHCHNLPLHRLRCVVTVCHDDLRGHQGNLRGPNRRVWVIQQSHRLQVLLCCRTRRAEGPNQATLNDVHWDAEASVIWDNTHFTILVSVATTSTKSEKARHAATAYEIQEADVKTHGTVKCLARIPMLPHYSMRPPGSIPRLGLNTKRTAPSSKTRATILA